MRFYVISDNIDTLVGLRFAGIEGEVVHEASGMREALTRAMENEEIGILLITEKLVALCPDLIYELKLKAKRPLIVEIPDRHGSGRAADSITRYVREAIGVRI